jgi:ABC-type transport system involved in multi-copper enzyme maturation permease subunit
MIAIARKELGDALRNRWVLSYAVLIALLGGTAAAVGLRSTGAMALQMFGRTTATLTNLALFLAPLVALVMGAAAVSSERDRGTLWRLLSLPITSTELLLGKFVGLLGALQLATLVGFAPAALMIGLVGGGAAFVKFLIFPMVTMLLIAAMLGVGLFVSVASPTGVRALGTAILLWFSFVLLYDLVLIGALTAVELRPGVLVALLIANPVDAARVLVVMLLEPDLYALGPAGAVLVTTLSRGGAMLLLFAVLLSWSVAPLLLSLRRFRITLFGSRRQRSTVVPTSACSPALREIAVRSFNE